MPRSTPALRLSEGQGKQIEQWLAAMGTPQQVAVRCRIIVALSEGETEAAIASELEINRKTVRLWRGASGRRVSIAFGILRQVADVRQRMTDARIRTYCSEPQRGRQRWKGQQREREAVYANRRRIGSARGKRLLRQRGEKLERWNEHLYDRGGMRRVHLRGRENILKRLLVHAGAANLGLLMRKIFGAGTPKSLQGRVVVSFSAARDLNGAVGVLRRSLTLDFGTFLRRSLISVTTWPSTAAA